MKRSFLFFALVILASCGQPKPESDTTVSQETVKHALKADDTLQSLIKANINQQPPIDSICLGFAFSMTKLQAMKHFNQMIKEKKLVYNDKDSRYEYPMNFELVKANASIAPEFQDDKLYQLSLVIQPADDMGTDETIYLQTATTYMKKYAGYSLFQEPDLLDPKEKKFHWIKNNLHIFLHKAIGGSIVSYTNMPVEQQMNKKKSKEADSSKSQTNKDI